MSYAELDQDQETLLLALADLQEATPKSERSNFYFHRSFGDSGHIEHKKLPNGQFAAYQGDIDVLVETGLLKKTLGFNGGLGFVVSTSGVAHARSIRLTQGEPSEAIEKDIIRWINADFFIRRYPEVHARWATAQQLLTSKSDKAAATSIGHLCREAMQLFTDQLVQRFKPANASSKPAETVNRLRAVLQGSNLLRDTPKALVDSLIVYWGALSDLVQRQEHGALREREPFSPEDSRRVVFYTFLVMFEIDRSIVR